MGDKKTHISVDIAVEDIRAALKKLICSDHSQLIGDVIIDNLLETDVGVKQLYLAMSGVREILKFKALDEVYIKYDYLYTSRILRTDNCRPLIPRRTFPFFLESLNTDSGFEIVYESDAVTIARRK